MNLLRLVVAVAICAFLSMPASAQWVEGMQPDKWLVGFGAGYSRGENAGPVPSGTDDFTDTPGSYGDSSVGTFGVHAARLFTPALGAELGLSLSLAGDGPAVHVDPLQPRSQANPRGYPNGAKWVSSGNELKDAPPGGRPATGYPAHHEVSSTSLSLSGLIRSPWSLARVRPYGQAGFSLSHVDWASWSASYGTYCDAARPPPGTSWTSDHLRSLNDDGQCVWSRPGRENEEDITDFTDTEEATVRYPGDSDWLLGTMVGAGLEVDLTPASWRRRDSNVYTDSLPSTAGLRLGWQRFLDSGIPRPDLYLLSLYLTY